MSTLLVPAFLFWGFAAGLLPLGLALATIVAARGLATRSWTLASGEAHRVGDLVAVLLAGSVVIQYSTERGSDAVMGVIRWLPVAISPLVVLQLYGAGDGLALGDVLRPLRRVVDADWKVDVRPGAFIACLVGAGAGNGGGPTYYLGATGLIVLALATVRPRASSRAAWVALVALAFVLGIAGAAAIAGAQRAIEETITRLIVGPGHLGHDPAGHRTSIGRIGELKLSDRIAFRVTTADGRWPATLLRDASYSLYVASAWSAPGAETVPVDPVRGSWPIAAEARRPRTLTVALALPTGEGVLPVPTGVGRLEPLPQGVVVSRSDLGAVEVADAPGLVHATFTFGLPGWADAPPTAIDRRIAPEGRATFARLAAELGLDATRPEEAMDRLAAHFSEGFGYSVFQDESELPPLRHFLEVSRAGHCELFATATVLALRAAGIPARYATGYGVVERSAFDDAWVVRERHAHAWALVWLDGRWIDFDTTPALWIDVEQARRPLWQPALDALSWVGFRITQWRWSLGRGRIDTGLRVLLLTLVAFLAWRVVRRLRGAETTASPRNVGRAIGGRRGLDSELYALERLLAADGLGRRPTETVRAWAARIDEAGGATPVALRPLADLHDRLRFDPAGLAPRDRERLRGAAEVRPGRATG